MIERLPTYIEMIKGLQCKTFPVIPAELHGYLCGFLSGKKDLGDTSSVETILELLEEEQLATPENRKVVRQLMAITLRQLQDVNCTFNLLLPDDEETMSFRCEALAKWCQSFVTGLGLSGIKKMEEEQSEVLRDIIGIAQLSYKKEKLLGESAEEAYAEIVEYIRAAVLLIYMEHGGGKHSSSELTFH